MDITFSPDGATVATCNGAFLYGDPSWITMWDVSSGKLVREIVAHKKQISSIAFNSDGSRLVSCSKSDFLNPDQNSELKIWDTQSGVELKVLNHKATGNVKIRFCDEDDLLVLAGDRDTKINLFNASRPSHSTVLIGHPSMVSEIYWDQESTKLCSIDSSGNRIVWDPDSATIVPATNWEAMDEPSVQSLDGRWMAIPMANDISLVELSKVATHNTLRNLIDRPSELARWHLLQANRARNLDDKFAESFHVANLWRIEKDHGDSFIYQERLITAVEKMIEMRSAHGSEVSDVPAIAAEMLEYGGELRVNGTAIKQDPLGQVSVTVELDKFQPILNKLNSIDYIPISFEFVNGDAKMIFANFKKEPGAQWEMRPRLTQDEFIAKDEEWNEKGGELMYQHQYMDDGKTFLGGIWKLHEK